MRNRERSGVGAAIVHSSSFFDGGRVEGRWTWWRRRHDEVLRENDDETEIILLSEGEEFQKTLVDWEKFAGCKKCSWLRRLC